MSWCLGNGWLLTALKLGRVECWVVRTGQYTVCVGEVVQRLVVRNTTFCPVDLCMCSFAVFHYLTYEGAMNLDM